uniref:Uncharacterized protein n=1 Tax=Arundo donax TaxID=35708 RepID=A0A0A9E6A2_ARUDO
MRASAWWENDGHYSVCTSFFAKFVYEQMCLHKIFLTEDWSWSTLTIKCNNLTSSQF